MAKTKGSKGVQNKHVHSRVSYLYQAATYLATAPNGGNSNQETSDSNRSEALVNPNEEQNHRIRTSETVDDPKVILEQDPGDHQPSSRFHTSRISNSQRHLLSHARSVARKSQIRLSRDVKRSVCKRCESLLISGSSSVVEMENGSRGRTKPWADVLVVTCSACQMQKRFPVGATRQRSKGSRSKLDDEDAAADATELGDPDGR